MRTGCCYRLFQTPASGTGTKRKDYRCKLYCPLLHYRILMADFNTRLRGIQTDRASRLCVGLDPDPQRLPSHLLNQYAVGDAVLQFNRAIIEATAPFACAFKLNFAFFEALGVDGWRVLRETARAAGRDHVVVADAKRGDIGNSARFYAAAAFEELECDACTVSPYMGRDSVEPFLSYAGRAAFVLVRTSNPGGADLQELVVNGRPLYMETARQARLWGDQLPGTTGFVVGATNAEPVAQVRSEYPDVPLLIPGVGAQGGDAGALLNALSVGAGPVLINSSRQILYASSRSDFAEAAATEASRIRDMLGAPD